MTHRGLRGSRRWEERWRAILFDRPVGRDRDLGDLGIRDRRLPWRWHERRAQWGRGASATLTALPARRMPTGPLRRPTVVRVKPVSNPNVAAPTMANLIAWKGGGFLVAIAAYAAATFDR